MDDQFSSVLKILDVLLNLSKANPYAVGISIFVLGLGYGWLKYKTKKWEEEQIIREQENDRLSNLDELEQDALNSNVLVRDRLRKRRD